MESTANKLDWTEERQSGTKEQVKETLDWDKTKCGWEDKQEAWPEHPRTSGADQESKPKNAQDEEGAEINAKSTEYLVNEIVAKSSTTRDIQNPK